MTKEEFENELEKLKETEQNINPYLDDPKYKELYMRYHAYCKEDFIFSEAIQIYANTDSDEVKVKILELLHKTDY